MVCRLASPCGRGLNDTRDGDPVLQYSVKLSVFSQTIYSAAERALYSVHASFIFSNILQTLSQTIIFTFKQPSHQQEL